MKYTVIKRIAMILAALALLATTGLAENGAKAYQQYCAKCHGKTGDGKMGPVIRGRSDIPEIILRGGLKKSPHSRPIAGVTEEEARAIARFLK
jgi:mono/diheme cytochrome c family protein